MVVTRRLFESVRYKFENSIPPRRDIFPHVYLPDEAVTRPDDFRLACTMIGTRLGKILSEAIFASHLYIDTGTQDRLCVRFADIVDHIRDEISFQLEDFQAIDVMHRLVRRFIKELRIDGLELAEDVFEVTHVIDQRGRARRRVKRRLARRTVSVAPTPIRLTRLPRNN